MIKLECDRCGTQQSVKAVASLGPITHSTLPGGWYRLAVPPPIAARAGSVDLCGRCVNTLAEFMRPLPKAAEPAKCANCGHDYHADEECGAAVSRNSETGLCTCAAELAELVEPQKAGDAGDPLCRVCAKAVFWDLATRAWLHRNRSSTHVARPA